jgi:flagellar biosynthesis GTPase FlhF
MADAAAQDEGVGYYEDLLYEREAQKRAAAFSYGGAAGIAMGMGATTNGVAMDEEEYAEYIRAGMWRRKNKDEVERLARLEKEKREREAKEAVENEKRRREERERIKRLEEKKRKTSEKEERDARERYESQWRKLTTASAPQPPRAAEGIDSDTTALFPLRFTDFPWPLYPPMPLPPLSWPAGKDVTASAISNFLLSHLSADKRKAVLRQAVLAYHPDRFERHVLRIPEEKEDVRERVRELGLRVSQTLNELMKAGGSV